ncbi:putative thiol-disulfide oxidoreductase [Gordonia araii NBRC 100433]|uniref:Putative thiol-disulfide oxidoreductase n=1 Tax=Gordonia araii NBRC 100433 TaxID=1073574 RepID=G7GYY2_9ACTN|nr:cytochrome c biogenesis CcdA family protein [Gordonia araii]NNG97017.1 cytochrome c biogenesis protein CcdA [Gordonia araii NBRC 100433]GAB08807.1 putative thiol-disulfide oxidoreductase [Gordonia araii NBRC 100433]
MELGLLGAFLGGVLTLLSPCSVMLMPAFFSFAFTSPGALIARTGVFYLGLITTLVPLGILAGSLGAFVNQHRATFVTVAAWIVIALGVVMVAGIPLPTLSRTSTASGTSTAAVYALGTVYGLAGVCAGPLLGAALTYAALGGNAALGGITLLVFAAGMVVPLLILAFAWDRLPAVQRLVRPREVSIGSWRNTWTMIVGGLLTIGVGVLLLLTDGTASLGGLVGATDQFRLESWIMRTTSGVPNALVVVVALAIAAAGWSVGYLGRRAPRGDKPGSPRT